MESRKYFRQWEDIDEQILESWKEKIDSDYSQVSKITDLRILSQLLLDYLDGLKAPLIAQASIEKLEILFDRQKKGEDLDKPEIIKEVISINNSSRSMSTSSLSSTESFDSSRSSRSQTRWSTTQR